MISFQEVGLSFNHKYKKFTAQIAVRMSLDPSSEINYKYKTIITILTII